MADSLTSGDNIRHMTEKSHVNTSCFEIFFVILLQIKDPTHITQ